MKSTTIQRVVILGTFAIIGIISAQAYWVLRTWDLKEKQFQQTVTIALQNVAGDLARLNGSSLPNSSLINQISSDYFVVNINDTVNVNNLDFYLKKELEAVAMAEDFEYGVYDCHSNKMIYGTYIGYSKGTAAVQNPTKDLPIYSEFNYYFGVRFPKRSSYLLNSMGLTITFSVILFIAVLFFLYSIFIILKQKRLSEMQKDFINNMTHEFKTPISTIKIASEVFIGNPMIQSDRRLSQYANIIREQNLRLNNQVEKVLQLAKIERDSFELNLEEVNLHELLTEVTESIELKIADMDGKFALSLTAQQFIIRADRLHLSNILHNLLDNAMKYCNGAPDIVVSTENKLNRLCLTIEDKGIGIKKEYHSKIFEKFFRVPTGNVHNVKGFGLGLFYVKNICDAHQWKVDLRSEENIGTCLKISMKTIG